MSDEEKKTESQKTLEYFGLAVFPESAREELVQLAEKYLPELRKFASEESARSSSSFTNEYTYKEGARSSSSSRNAYKGVGEVPPPYPGGEQALREAIDQATKRLEVAKASQMHRLIKSAHTELKTLMRYVEPHHDTEETLPVDKIGYPAGKHKDPILPKNSTLEGPRDAPPERESVMGHEMWPSPSDAETERRKRIEENARRWMYSGAGVEPSVYEVNVPPYPPDTNTLRIKVTPDGVPHAVDEEEDAKSVSGEGMRGSKSPNKKVLAGVGGGAIGGHAIAYFWFALTGLEMPVTVAIDVAVVVGGLIGYFVTERH